MARVLIVDDERGMRITLRELLRDEGHEVDAVGDAEHAISYLSENPVDVVVSDILLPNTSGVELLRRIRTISDSIQVILITGEPTVETAINAVRAGAFDYLSKPVSGEAISLVVGNAARIKALNDENRRLYAELLAHKEHLEELVERRNRALHESEAMYRSLVELASDGICIIRRSRLVYVNQRLADMLGFSAGSLLNRPFQDFIDPVDLPIIMDLHRRHLEGERNLGITSARMLREDGTPLVVELNGSIISYRGEESQLVIIRETTGRQTIGEVLQASEARFRSLAEKSRDALFRFRLTPTPAFEYISPAVDELIGYDEQAFYADPFIYKRLLEPTDATLAEELFSYPAKAPEKPVVFAMRHRDGRQIWTEMSVVSYVSEPGGEVIFSGIVRDVTERVVGEAKLSARDRVLEAVAFAAEQFLKAESWEQAIEDCLRRLGEASQATRVCLFENTFFRRKRLLFSLRSIWQNREAGHSVAPDALQEIHYGDAGLSRWAALLENRGMVCGPMAEFPPGEQGVLEQLGVGSLVAVPVFAGSKWFGFLAVGDCRPDRQWSPLERDVLRTAANIIGASVDRAGTFRTLKQVEAQYAALLNHGQDGIAILDADERFVHLNEQAERLLGAPLERLRGERIDIFVDGANMELIDTQTELALNGGERTYDLHITTPAGEPRRLTVTIFPRFDQVKNFSGAFVILKEHEGP